MSDGEAAYSCVHQWKEGTDTMLSVETMDAPAQAAPSVLPLDDAQDFAAWLEGMPPEKKCGQQHQGQVCPLARYLIARHGPQSEPFVHPSFYCVQGQYYATPLWARLFVIRVDLFPSPLHHGRLISAGEARACLDDALREEQRGAAQRGGQHE